MVYDLRSETPKIVVKIMFTLKNLKNYAGYTLRNAKMI